MKAAVCHAFGEPLVVEEVALDPPRDGEVKVRLAACAICHSDIHYIEGAWGGRLPVVCGHEASGAVDAVGAGVGHVKPGDHVVVALIRSCGRCFYCVQGDPTQCETQFRLDAESPLHAADGRTVRHGLRTAAFAECVVVHESQVVQVPKSLPLDSASLLACGVITGVGAVTNTAKVPSRSSVVVIGTGGVGLNSVQGATLSGAKPIIAVDLADDKLAAAEAFGATHGVNPTAGDARDRVAALTGGRGADFVFVTVGSATAIEQGLGLLRKSGTLVVVGMPASGVTAAFEAATFADSGQRILGSKMGGSRPRVDVPKLVELYEQGRLKLDELVTRRYPLGEINQAIASVKRGEALRNVIVF